MDECRLRLKFPVLRVLAEPALELQILSLMGTFNVFETLEYLPGEFDVEKEIQNATLSVRARLLEVCVTHFTGHELLYSHH